MASPASNMLSQHSSKTSSMKKEGLRIPFPFEPYPAQKALMEQLYKTIDAGHIGLFESPTGTGKSLSLICASLYWLRDRQRRDEAGEEDPLAAPSLSSTRHGATAMATNTGGETEPDWLRDYGKVKEREAAIEKRRKIRERQQALQRRLEEARHADDRSNTLRKEKYLHGNIGLIERCKKRPFDAGRRGDKKAEGLWDDEEDADLLPVKYESGCEQDDDSDRESTPNDLAYGIDKEGDEGEELDRNTRKILYCSRTHSQVSQFVMEIQKTDFRDDVRVISLSSRKNLCINEEVLKLGSDSRISDRCLDLQKGKNTNIVVSDMQSDQKDTSDKADSKGTKKRPRADASKRQVKCPFLLERDQRQDLYRDYALSKIRNLEDLAALGKKLDTCPYYGTRRAVAQAEVICMPYATLLHKGTRESMKIPLKGNVVLIDEAHNLVEAINAVHTTQLSLQVMSRALNQITLYWERYKSRLSGKNTVYVQQIIRLLGGLVKFVRRKASPHVLATTSATGQEDASATVIMTVNELVFEAGMDNVNLFKVVRYMEQSQISKKVLGFVDRRGTEVQIHGSESTFPATCSPSQATDAGVHGESSAGLGDYVSNNISSLQNVQTFLVTLTGSSRDGRIVLETGHGPQKGRRQMAAGIKFIMLNAAVHFREIVSEARSVVLVGGTMQPVAPIVAQLFPDLPISRLDVFSCGHVIPPQNLLALCMSKGPTGIDFDFTHKSRGLVQQMDELGRLLLNVSTVTPGGLVVFLPSYAYEEKLMTRWRESNLLSKLRSKKSIFSEPKQAKDVEATLQAYSAAIAEGEIHRKEQCSGSGSVGAILFCVVGAKMSEGINFADGMARGVVMVGLPYPDRRDPELQQKMQYLDSLQFFKGAAAANDNSMRSNTEKCIAIGATCGKTYYQNLCMRAVNQSIGRAIRHANDWAAIILVDRRYFADPSIVSLLPKWIADRIVPYNHSQNFGRAFVQLSRFFKDKVDDK